MSVNNELVTREEWVKKNVKKGALVIGGLFVASILTKVSEAKDLIYKDSNGIQYNLTTNLNTEYLRLNQTSPQTTTGVFNLTPRIAVDVNRYGFLNQTETTITFDGTNLFTLAGTNWSYYRAGIKYTIAGNKTVTLPGSPVTTGTYYIYIDATDGTLTQSTVAWTLNDTLVPVAVIKFNNALTPKYHMADERHSCLIDRRDHYYNHFTKGAQLQTVGTLAGYTPNTDTNVAKTFSIGATALLDEDIIITNAQLADPDGTSADYVVFYRTAISTWVWKASNMPFVYNVGNTNNIIQYDNAGTMTDCGTGAGALTRWVNSYLIATNFNGAARFIIIMGQAEYTSLASAQAELFSSLILTGLGIAEFAVMYRMTWSTITSTSQGKCVLAANPVAVVGTNVVGVSFVETDPIAMPYILNRTIVIDGDLGSLFAIGQYHKKIPFKDRGAGITVKNIKVQSQVADPATEMYATILGYANDQGTGAFPGASQTVIQNNITTTTGNYDSGAIAVNVPTGKQMYLYVPYDPGLNQIWTVTITYVVI